MIKFSKNNIFPEYVLRESMNLKKRGSTSKKGKKQNSLIKKLKKLSNNNNKLLLSDDVDNNQHQLTTYEIIKLSYVNPSIKSLYDHDTNIKRRSIDNTSIKDILNESRPQKIYNKTLLNDSEIRKIEAKDDKYEKIANLSRRQIEAKKFNNMLKMAKKSYFSNEEQVLRDILPKKIAKDSRGSVNLYGAIVSTKDIFAASDDREFDCLRAFTKNRQPQSKAKTKLLSRLISKAINSNDNTNNMQDLSWEEQALREIENNLKHVGNVSVEKMKKFYKIRNFINNNLGNIKDHVQRRYKKKQKQIDSDIDRFEKSKKLIQKNKQLLASQIKDLTKKANANKNGITIDGSEYYHKEKEKLFSYIKKNVLKSKTSFEEI